MNSLFFKLQVPIYGRNGGNMMSWLKSYIVC